MDKRIEDLEKRVAELEELFNDHCIMTTGEPAVKKEASAIEKALSDKQGKGRG